MVVIPLICCFLVVFPSLNRYGRLDAFWLKDTRVKKKAAETLFLKPLAILSPQSGESDGTRKDNWEYMGTYDTNMTEWGGEHIEACQKGTRTWFRV